jgi:hypothetical protein
MKQECFLIFSRKISKVIIPVKEFNARLTGLNVLLGA